MTYRLLVFIFMVTCQLALTQVCNNDNNNKNHDSAKNFNSKQEEDLNPAIRIQLDSNSVLSAPSGVYTTVQFHLSLATQTSDPDLNLTKTAQISHFEKFPSRGRHATFVTSVRPQTVELRSNDSPVTVTLTIFAPKYVPNQTRHSVSFLSSFTI